MTAALTGLADERAAEVRRALARVDDPELDEPVTDLRFVERLEIDAAGHVTIGFRLPTYWCAANFAFMMADDMRREVSALPWVSRVDVVLGEHMYAETINQGIAAGLDFRQAFGGDADGDLQNLRRAFRIKAFQRRQEALLRHLLAAGHAPDAVADLTLAALDVLDLSPDGCTLRRRYLDRREVCAGPGETRAFVDIAGAALDAAGLATYLRTLARTGVNAEFNGMLCRSLLAARFDEPMDALAAEPTLRDFVVQAARTQRQLGTQA